MKNHQAFGKGFRQLFKSPKLTFVLYMASLLPALAVAIPFRDQLKASEPFSMRWRQLLEGFDYATYADFTREFGDMVAGFQSQMVWVTMLYLVFQIFLSGGILTFFEEKKGFSASSFFAGCGQFWWSFLKVSLLFWALQLFCLGIFGAISFGILTAVWMSTYSETMAFYGGVIALGAMLLIFHLIKMLADYARISLVTGGSQTVWQAFKAGFRFGFGKFRAAYSLHLGIAAINLAAIALYLLVESWVPMVSTGTILIMFLIQQASIVARIAGRAWLMGAQLLYFEGKKRTVVPEGIETSR